MTRPLPEPGPSLSVETLLAVAEHFDVIAVGDDVGMAACAAIPQLHGRDARIVEDTIVAATSNVKAILDGLLNGADEGTLVAPTASLDWAESLVHRAVDVSAVPWAYSFGQARVGDALRAAVERSDVSLSEKWEVASALSRYVNAYVEHVCAEMVDHYTETRETHYGDARAARRDVVESVLRGEVADGAGVTEAIGYDVSGPQVAVIVWADARAVDRPASTALVEEAKRLLAVLGASRTLVLPSAQDTVWGWGGGASVVDGVQDTLTVSQGVSAGVGALGSGLSGFVRSHHDAVQSRRMSDLLGRRTGSVVRYQAVALASLITSDAGQAGRFVREELGPVADDSDQMRRLRATLTTFLDEGMRPVRAARRLGIHQNTVLYRIRQAEELLGRPLTERRLELEAALRLAATGDWTPPAAG